MPAKKRARYDKTIYEVLEILFATHQEFYLPKNIGLTVFLFKRYS